MVAGSWGQRAVVVVVAMVVAAPAASQLVCAVTAARRCVLTLRTKLTHRENTKNENKIMPVT